MYIRFQSALPNARGTYPGVFALANGLASDGRLSAVDAAWWRASNDWGNGAYTDPSTVDPTIFDRSANPGACAWFKQSAHELLAYTRRYADFVRSYGVGVDEVHSLNPGKVLYEDDVQVVVAPPVHQIVITRDRHVR